VPGSPLDPRCRGSNDLIRQGAHLCETAEDVLATLPAAPHALPLFAGRFAPARPAPEPAAAGETPGEAPGEADQVLDLIGASPVPVDEVMRRCHLSPSAVQAALLELELSGRVELLPGNRVVRLG
jgi:DNA processing protein